MSHDEHANYLLNRDEMKHADVADDSIVDYSRNVKLDWNSIMRAAKADMESIAYMLRQMSGAEKETRSEAARKRWTRLRPALEREIRRAINDSAGEHIVHEDGPAALSRTTAHTPKRIKPRRGGMLSMVDDKKCPLPTVDRSQNPAAEI